MKLQKKMFFSLVLPILSNLIFTEERIKYVSRNWEKISR